MSWLVMACKFFGGFIYASQLATALALNPLAGISKKLYA